MIRALLLVSLILPSAYAKQTVELLNETALLELVNNEVDPAETCMDEYLKRSTQLKWFLFIAPPAGIAAIPVGVAIGGGIGDFMANNFAIFGWDLIAYGMGGAMLGAMSAIVVTTTLEVKRAIEYSQNKKIMGLISASRANQLENKHLQWFLNKYNRSHKDKNISAQQLAFAVSHYDSNGSLCNNEIRSHKKGKRLKHRLARVKDIIKYLYQNQ